MYFEQKQRKNGEYTYYAVDRYVDPLTGKARKTSLKFYNNTARGRKQAKLDLAAKIEETIKQQEGAFAGSTMVTFGELKTQWLETWQLGVKPPTINREMMILRRFGDLISDDVRLDRITPLLVQNCLNSYRSKYHSTHATMQHIKCTLNKIFDFGVLHHAIAYSPSRVIKLTATAAERRAKKKRREEKFMNQREVHALLSELHKRRNQTYYDLTLFMIGTGCRIGEAAALTEADIDFENGFVTIDKSLQYHDLRIDEFYADTTKTEAGERVEQLPEFALAAVKRVIARNKDLEANMALVGAEVFHHSDSIFRTEYGAPITSHAFREILTRVNKWLREHCVEEYGFKWTKNAIPHGLRHVHISVLRNDPTVPLKEVQHRVGHVMAETTNAYTHLMNNDQTNSVAAITRFIENVK